ncbi:MAG: secretion activating protein [Synergistaceae bacterium]|nr:secretion activating protein [Synergistaceae bacterium]
MPLAFLTQVVRHMDNHEKFTRSIDFTLHWEGGRNFTVKDGLHVLNPAAKNDPGGATAYGITSRTLKSAFKAGIVHHEDICRLTVDEAKEIYRANYWDKYGWGSLEWPACMCCFDCSVNHGKFALILQRAANDCGSPCVIDGIFGPKTFAALKSCDPLTLSATIYRRRKEYYNKLIARNPKQEIFRKGWFNRANDMAKVAGVLS